MIFPGLFKHMVGLYKISACAVKYATCLFQGIYMNQDQWKFANNLFLHQYSIVSKKYLVYSFLRLVKTQWRLGTKKGVNTTKKQTVQSTFIQGSQGAPRATNINPGWLGKGLVLV